MAKYSYEFKKQVIEAYLSGEGGYKYLAKRYGVPAWSNIKKWVRNYETHGDKGLCLLYTSQAFCIGKRSCCSSGTFIVFQYPAGNGLFIFGIVYFRK